MEKSVIWSYSARIKRLLTLIAWLLVYRGIHWLAPSCLAIQCWSCAQQTCVWTKWLYKIMLDCAHPADLYGITCSHTQSYKRDICEVLLSHLLARPAGSWALHTIDIDALASYHIYIYIMNQETYQFSTLHILSDLFVQGTFLGINHIH